MRLKRSVREINLLSLFFLLNLNFFISTRIAKLASVLTRQNSIRVQGIFFGVAKKLQFLFNFNDQGLIQLFEGFPAIIFG